MKRYGTTKVAAAAAISLGMSLLVPVSAQADDAVPVATGTLTSSSGTPATGIRVVLLAEPIDAKVAVGSSVPVSVVGTATTDSAGGYTLTVADQKAVAAAADTDGNVQLTAKVFMNGVNGKVFTFTRHLDRSTGQLTVVPVSNQPASASIARSASSSVAQADFSVPASAATAAGARTNVAASPHALFCDAKNLGEKSVNTTVARYYGTIGAARGKGTYSKGASSELGVGVSSNGSSWSASGSVTTTSNTSTTETNGTQSGAFATAVNTYFHFRKVDLQCSENGGPITHDYKTQATGYDGGLHYGALSSTPSTPYCKPQSSGYSITKSDSTATKFAGGADTSAWIGIDLSAQSGYSNNVEVTLSLSGGSGRVCGIDNYAAASPGVMAIRAS